MNTLSTQSDVPLAHADVHVSIAGNPCVLLPERALFSPSCGTLLVADMHLGKAETFAAFGAPMPAGMLDADLARLERVIARSGATRLVIVGDLLHGGVGLTPQLVDAVAACVRKTGVPWVLVPGNHDRAIARVSQAWNLTITPAQHDLGWCVASHEPAEIEGRVVVCGHLHPAVRVGPAAFTVKLPAFVVGPRTVVLPAFNEFTGGGCMRSPGARFFGVAEAKVLEIRAGRVDAVAQR